MTNNGYNPFLSLATVNGVLRELNTPYQVECGCDEHGFTIDELWLIEHRSEDDPCGYIVRDYKSPAGRVTMEAFLDILKDVRFAMEARITANG